MFPKPFFACFSRKSAARATIQAGPGKTKSGQNDSKNTGFWKPVASKKRKKSGFCVGRARKPRFLQCILVLLLLKASLELPGAFWKPPGASGASWRFPEGSLEASSGLWSPRARKTKSHTITVLYGRCFFSGLNLNKKCKGTGLQPLQTKNEEGLLYQAFSKREMEKSCSTKLPRRRIATWSK